MAARRSFARQLARMTIIVVLNLIVGALLVESLMIVLEPYLAIGFVQYDRDVGYRVRPHYRRDDGCVSNQFGFNDRDYALQKDPGIFRILVIGDSFAWAGGCRGNYTALLEQKFEAYYGSHKIDVVNTGYPGTHTGTQLLMLRKYALKYSPDIVLLGFFAGNDFIDADPNQKKIAVNGCYVDIDKRQERRFLGYPIIPQSRALLFLRQKYEIHRQSKLAAREAEEWAAANAQPVPKGNLPEETFLRLQRAKLEFFNKTTYRQHFQTHVTYILESINEMNELLKSRSIPLLVGIYPDEMQVSQPQFERLVEKFQLNRTDYDLDLAQEILVPFLDSKKIACLDLTLVFRAEESQRELYLLRNTHWNESGNELAAETLFQYLIRHADDCRLPARDLSASRR